MVPACGWVVSPRSIDATTETLTPASCANFSWVQPRQSRAARKEVIAAECNALDPASGECCVVDAFILL